MNSPLTTRPATLDDVPAIYALLQSHERALYGYSDKLLNGSQATVMLQPPGVLMHHCRLAYLVP